jgi:hypothetical protein
VIFLEPRPGLRVVLPGPETRHRAGPPRPVLRAATRPGRRASGRWAASSPASRAPDGTDRRRGHFGCSRALAYLQPAKQAAYGVLQPAATTRSELLANSTSTWRLPFAAKLILITSHGLRDIDYHDVRQTKTALRASAELLGTVSHGLWWCTWERSLVPQTAATTQHLIVGALLPKSSLRHLHSR